MKRASSSSHAVIWASALAMASSFGASALAWADSPVLLWGYQRGCDRMADTDRIVERQLHRERRDVALLRTSDGQPLPACSGERCAQALRAACPNIKGRLLGGQGIQGKPVRTRLWLFDFSTGQIAFQDEFCHTCNVIGALTDHTRSLLDHPQFGPPPSPAPSYCSAPSSSRSDSSARKGPVFLHVYGDGKHKSSIASSLRSQLDALGRSAPPFDFKAFTKDEIDRALAGQLAAKVLSALVQKDGSITLQLYDQKARVSDSEEVTCQDCSTEALISKLKDVVSELLDRCAGSLCAAQVLSGSLPPPGAACEPFPSDQCSSPELDSLLSARPSALVGSGGGGLDPKTARLIKGLSWGGFAASAATGISLFALSGTSAGQVKATSGGTIGNTLDVGAWTATGISAVLLGLSIPLTVVVDRAAARSAQPTSGTSAPAFIQCPN